MMDENQQNESLDKDQILSHFQEICNFYDVEQSQAILESTSWNLDQAVQSFFNGDTMITETINHQPVNNLTRPSAPEQLNPFAFDDRSDLFANGVSIKRNDQSSFKSKRLLTFNIEYFSKKFTLYVPDESTVQELKELISNEINLPIKHQKLKGWKNKDAPVSDSMELSLLSLPLENNLFVINTDSKFQSSEHMFDSTPATSSSKSTQVDSYELNIKFNSKAYRLQFDSETKLIDIKRRVAKLAAINVYDQEWWYSNESWDDENSSDVSLEKLIESGAVFSLPLSAITKPDSNLNEIKHVLNSLTETNTKIGVTGQSVHKPFIFTLNQNDSSFANSKLTPETKATASNNVYKMTFLVTMRTSRSAESKSDQTAPTTSGTAGVKPEDNLENYQLDDDEENFEEEFEINQKTGLISDKKSSTNQPKLLKQDTNEENDNHELDEDDIDDNFTLDTTTKQSALIPASCPVGDEYLGTTQFVDEFFKRYQPIIPLFFIGTLEDAIKEALLCPARNRKLLGIYLHSDKSVCRHIFCSKTLCDENVVNFLISNFIVWGWDITNPEHEAHFYSTCSKFLGSVVINQLKSNKIMFPAFLIVNRMRGTNEVIAVVPGDSSQESMMTSLMHAYEMFEEQRLRDVKDEQTRDERERIKREQDAAYQQSLETDKAKRQKQTEEFERQKEQARLEEENQRRLVEEKENFMKKCLASLSSEPDEKTPANQLTRIRFRLPTGETLQRRFLITDKLREIINFMNGNGYLNDEYKLLSSWPRRDLTSQEISSDQTIEQLKLFPQETLTVEKRT